jgi:hypothetical protein
MSHLAVLPSALPAAQCIPSNDLVLGPLRGVFTQLSGAVNAVILPLGLLMLLVLVVMFIVTVLNKGSSRFIKAAGTVVGAILLVPLAVLLIAALQTLFMNACSTSPF